MPMTMAQRTTYNALLAQRAEWEDRMKAHQQRGRWAMYRNAREVVRAHDQAINAVVGA